MKLTIISEDNAVYIDGVSHSELDLSGIAIPSDVHALQWNQTAGWIEFKDNFDGTKPRNEVIDSLPDWANACVTVWNNWTPPAPPVAPDGTQPATTGTLAA